MKFCRDCTWRDGNICAHPKSLDYDLVTGEPFHNACSAMRIHRCGSEARFFDPQPDVLANEETPMPAIPF